MTDNTHQATPFSWDQIVMTILFVFVLMTIVVDYMTLPALSAILIPELGISTKQFGILVSVYAFSAGTSGFLATGFADSFDRKKLLLVYFGGFLLGMGLCAIADSWTTFIIGRVVAGIFGGVVASICFAIVADVFTTDQRGRVMSYVQMAFAISHIVGLPLALYIATQYAWHLIYWVFFVFGLVVFAALVFLIKPVKEHLQAEQKENLLQHSIGVVRNLKYWSVFANNIFLVLGDVMFMTLYSAYCTSNLGVGLEDLPILFGISGVASIILSPFIGHVTDKFGKLNVFVWGSVLAMAMVATLSFIGDSPFWIIATLHTALFIGISIRMISSTALATVVPQQKDRGGFMAVDASFQQIAGGVAATVAGVLVIQLADGRVEGYPVLGIVFIGLMLITVGLMWKINKSVTHQD